MPEVDPVKSEADITSGGHSGCERISISGFCFLISLISLNSNSISPDKYELNRRH